VGQLLEHLADTGRIRRVPLRSFHFLVSHGGAAPYTLLALAECFDPESPLKPDAVDLDAELVTDLIIGGLSLDRSSGFRGAPETRGEEAQHASQHASQAAPVAE
jgi:hypothetical protein